MTAPLQGEIEYETRRFNVSAPRNTSIYSSDPSPEVDQAWNDLYNGAKLQVVLSRRISQLI